MTSHMASQVRSAPGVAPAWRRVDREIDFAIRKSSRDLFWTGFVAYIYDATPGHDDTRFASHSLSMHIGSPVPITTACDGASVHRLHVAGDLKLIPAGYLRHWDAQGPASKLTLNLQPALLRSAAEAMGLDLDGVSLAPQLHMRDPRIEHIAWALKAELEASEPVGRLYADSLGLALATHLLRRYGSIVPRRIAGGLPKRRLARVIEYIAENLTCDLTLAELADVAYMSPSHFKLLFKQSVGLPVHQYVIRSRVEYAMQLLARGHLAPSEVALQAGFANQSHMARCVRRVTGLTPSAVRRAAG